MALDTTVRVEHADRGEIVGSVDVGGDVNRVRFVGPLVSDAGANEAMMLAGLFPAMSSTSRLSAVDPVSPRLLAALPLVQDIVRSWEQRYPSYERYQRVEISAQPSPPTPPASGRGVASFFTAGVDSFFTAVTHRDEIDALVHVCGFDVRPGNDALQQRVLEGVAAAADGLGKPLVVVECDLRSFGDRYANWAVYHGAALAAVGHALAGRFHTIHVPATLTYAHLVPLGSHPLLDPLWSSETMEIRHDGAEASRIDKLERIADEPAARRWLRVCWENRGGAYNCGRCEKCLRTMVALRSLDRLDDFETLPHVIDEGAIRAVTLPEVRYTWEASLARLEVSGHDPGLARALRRRLYGTTARLVHGGRYYAGRVRKRVRRIAR